METFPQVIVADNQQEGLIIAKDLLYRKVNDQTLLLLSGGSTPKDLYETLAKEGKLKAAAVGMIDERYGDPLHEDSNEKILEDSGLLKYFKNKNTPFYGVLQKNLDLKNTALQYDEKIKVLFSSFPKSVGILGIGTDGHTAGIPARTQNSPVPSGGKLKTQNYVENVNNFPGEIKKRITLTFKALAEMDLLIILAFGSAKKNALNLMFKDGSIEKVPARFYTKPEIANKTLLITDQKV